ncbi:MAG: MCE family protein [Chitinophagaceae bacterium]|nr:MCE family protein [Chitinophagaceae bacterium]
MKVSNEMKVGVLATVAIVLLVLGYNLLRGKNVFSRDNVFYIRYENAGGIAPAGSVRYKGMKVGHVQDIKLATDGSGQIVVSVAITPDLQIPRGSTATVVSPDLISPKAIQLDFVASNDFYNSHDTLVSKVGRNGIQEVQSQAEALIATIDSAINSISGIFNSETKLNLQKSVKSIESTLKTLDNATSKMDVMLNDNVSRLDHIFSNVESITTNLKNNQEEINNLISNLSAISDTVKRSEIGATVREAKEVLEEVRNVMIKINEGKGSMGLLMNDDKLYHNLESSTQSLDALLIDMKANPGRYVQVSVFGKKDKTPQETQNK